MPVNEKNNKKHTLIKIIIIFIVLIIIAIISILYLMENSKKKTYIENVESIIETIKLDFSNCQTDSIIDCSKIYEFKNGEYITDDILSFDVDIPFSGTISINSNADVTIENLISSDKRYIANKKIDSDEIEISKANLEDTILQISLLDKVLDGEFTIENDITVTTNENSFTVNVPYLSNGKILVTGNYENISKIYIKGHRSSENYSSDNSSFLILYTIDSEEIQVEKNQTSDEDFEYEINLDDGSTITSFGLELPVGEVEITQWYIS